MIKHLGILAFAVASCASQPNGLIAQDHTLNPSSATELKIDGWNYGDADLMYSFGLPPIAIGSIASDGRIDFDFPTEVKPTQSLKLMFGCANARTVKISDPAATYEATPVALLVADFEKQKRYGYLVASESHAVGESRLGVANTPLNPGAYYQWLYVAQPTRVSGFCASLLEVALDETRDIRSDFDLDLQPGWNIVKTNVLSVVESSGGKFYPVDVEYQTVPELPGGTVFTFADDPAG